MEKKLVVFRLDEKKFAIHLSNVERVIHSVDFQSLPKAPSHISGTINYHGDFLPLVNIRSLFGIKPKEIELTDHFIIANTETIKLALWVDSVDEIVTLSDDEISKTDRIMLDSENVEGIFKLRDGIVLINDIDKFFSNAQIEKILASLQKLRKEGKEKAEEKLN